MTDDADDNDSDANDRADTRSARDMREAHRKLDDIAVGQQIVAQVHRSEDRILVEVRRVSHDVDSIKRSLHGEGDGRTGLVARVTNLEQGAQERSAQLTRDAAERLEDKRGRNAWVAATIAALAAIVTAVIAAGALWLAHR